MKRWDGSRRPYFPVPIKFGIALFFASVWTIFSIYLSSMWMDELGAVTHPLFALVAISFIAYVPGFMNAFLVTTLLLDSRPKRAPLDNYPASPS